MSEEELDEFMSSVYVDGVPENVEGIEGIDDMSEGSAGSEVFNETNTMEIIGYDDLSEQIEVSNSIGAGIIFCLGIIAGILLIQNFFARWK